MILRKSRNSSEKKTFVYLPVKDQIVFPQQATSINLIASPVYADVISKVAEEKASLVLVYIDENREYNLYDSHCEQYLLPIATEVSVLRVNSLTDKSQKIYVEASKRVQILDFVWNLHPMVITEDLPQLDEGSENKQKIALTNLRVAFDIYSRGKNIPLIVSSRIQTHRSLELVLGLVLQYLPPHIEFKKEILLTLNLVKNLVQVKQIIEIENELNNLNYSVDKRIKTRITKNQKDQFLREKIGEMEKELGEEDSENKNLYDKLKSITFPDEASQNKVFQEYSRYKRSTPMTAESSLLRTYLEWIIDLPWGLKTVDKRDILFAKQLLDSHHYSLKNVKEHVLDFIASKQRNTNVKSPILCFVGPPGTGKTSLGQSIADSLGREFVRIALGGARDEAEIRGHRKTYIGALPGKILQALKRAGSLNPVIMLDEIDKLGNDYRGDPSSALLEVLDPEQNHKFVDNYLEIPFDLSDVMFVATANDSSGIPLPLLDRMELLEVPSYTQSEKEIIARNFLLPKFIKENDLNPVHVHISDEVIYNIITQYTREAGVRGLSKKLNGLLRKSLRLELENNLKKPGNYCINASYFHEGPTFMKAHRSLFLEGFNHIPLPLKVESSDLPNLLGVPRYKNIEKYKNLSVGTSLGLAWTQVGGTILPIESLFVAGKGKIQLTGKLGDIMKESATLAISYIRKYFPPKDSDFFEKNDLHLHVPEGAIPKDGPSAGTALTISLLSALLEQPLPYPIAMTGEITLTGRILPVGGIREKVLAAYRNDIKKLYLPKDNRLDYEELDDNVKEQLDVSFVEEVIEIIGELFPQEKAYE